MQTDSRSRAGFTLVELIVTISILTVLAGILVPSINSYIDKGNSGKAHADLREIANVFNRFKVDTTYWPSPTDSTAAIKTGKTDFTGYPGLYRNTLNKPQWGGPYMNEGVMKDGVMHVATWSSETSTGTGMLDPWNRTYRVYTFAPGYNSTTGGIVVLSAGKNGKVDTSTDDIFQVKPAVDDVLQLVTYNAN